MGTTTVTTYPFDPTGKLASNKITYEQQIITSNNWRDYHFIVPKFAPYFADTIKVKFKALDGSIRYLVEGQDWYPSHEFISASRACATPIFGSISFLNTSLSGVVIIESYQTVGGIWVLDEVGIAELLADRLHNPRITTWESIVDLPATFPVIDHEWDLVDMVGMKEVVGELSGIEEQLRMSGQQGLADHIADKTNPHGVTRLQVGLGLVKNYDIAPVNEAQVGTSNSFYMTPMTVKAAIDQMVGISYAAHAVNNNNPHGTTAAQVGAYSKLETDTKLAGKLSTNGTAADSSHLDGMSSADLKAWVLNGTAANAVNAYGLSLNELRLEIQGGASADSNMFAGRTWDEAYAEILGGTAAAATKFGGKTATEYANYVWAGTCANATQFAGYTYDQVLAAARDGTVANSLKLEDHTLEQVIGLTLQGKAADSYRFDGKTYADLKTDLQTMTASNAGTLQGKTVDEIVTLAQSGTTVNASLLENMTVTDIIYAAQTGTATNASKFSGLTSDDWNNNIRDLITNQAPYMGYQSYTSGEVNAESWIKIGDIKYPTTQTLEDNSTIADAQWIISGGGGLGATDDASYYMRISVRGDARLNAPSFSIRNLSNVDSNINFGYTLDAATESIPAKVNVWVKVKKNHTRIAVTDLTHGFTDSTYNGVITTNSAPVAVEPTGILYITSIEKYVTNIDLTASSETINTRIGTVETNLTTLTTEINQAFSDLATAFDELKASIAAA